VLKESEDDFLVISEVPLILTFFFLVLDSEFVDFFFLLVQNLVLLRVFVLSWLRSARNLVLNLFYILLVCFNHFAHVRDFFFLLLDLSIVFLDPVHKSLTSFWEGQIHFVCLKLKIFLSLREVVLFVPQMLGSLLQCVCLQAVFSLAQSSVYFLQLVAWVVNLSKQLIVVTFELFVFISLFGVQIVKLRLVCKVDFLYLLLIAVDLIFHITLFAEKTVKMCSLLIVLVLNVHIKSFDVLWLCVRSMLVESQVVISQLTFVFAYVFD